MIPAIILAAGKSTRMSRLKATLSAGSGADTLLTRIIRTFQQADVEDVVVVIGHEADDVRKSVAASGLMARLVANTDYERGQLSSVLTGLRAIDRPGVNAMLLALVDTPFVSAQTVRSVVQRYRASGAPIVRPVRGAEHGHPVLIDRTLFDGLRAADPVSGVKPIVRAHVSAAGDVVTDDEGAFLDIDTPEDYARALAIFGARLLDSKQT